MGWIIHQLNSMQYQCSQTKKSDSIKPTPNNQKLPNSGFKTQQRVNKLLDNSPVVIFSCQPQPNYQITFISDNVKILLGYDVVELLREKDIWHTYVPASDQDQWQMLLGNY